MSSGTSQSEDLYNFHLCLIGFPSFCILAQVWCTILLSQWLMKRRPDLGKTEMEWAALNWGLATVGYSGVSSFASSLGNLKWQEEGKTLRKCFPEEALLARLRLGSQVIATGKQYEVRDFVTRCFKFVGIDITSPFREQFDAEFWLLGRKMHFCLKIAYSSLPSSYCLLLSP